MCVCVYFMSRYGGFVKLSKGKKKQTRREMKRQKTQDVGGFGGEREITLIVLSKEALLVCN